MKPFKRLLLVLVLSLGLQANTQVSPLQFFMLHTETAGAVAAAADFERIGTTQTLSGANGYNINVQPYFGTYKDFIVIVHTINIAAGADINVRTSANGTTFDDGATDYLWGHGRADGVNRSNTAATVNLFPLGNGTGVDCNGYLEIVDPANTTLQKTVRYWLDGIDYFNNAQFQRGFLRRLATTQIHAIRLYTTNAANFNLSYTLYGRK